MDFWKSKESLDDIPMRVAPDARGLPKLYPEPITEHDFVTMVHKRNVQQLTPLEKQAMDNIIDAEKAYRNKYNANMKKVANQYLTTAKSLLKLPKQTGRKRKAQQPIGTRRKRTRRSRSRSSAVKTLNKRKRAPTDAAQQPAAKRQRTQMSGTEEWLQAFRTMNV